jgi:hypothetical protein
VMNMVLHSHYAITVSLDPRQDSAHDGSEHGD